MLTKEGSSEPCIINSLQELLCVSNNGKMLEQQNGNICSMDINLNKCNKTYLICITDIAQEKHFTECGIIRDSDTISLSFDKCLTTKFTGEYVTKSCLKLEYYKTYTVANNEEKLCNIIIKNRTGSSSMWDVFLIQVDNSSKYSKSNKGRSGKFCLYVLYCLCFPLLYLIIWEWYQKLYSSVKYF